MKNPILSGFVLGTALLLASSFSIPRPAPPRLSAHLSAADEMTPAQRKFVVDYYRSAEARLLKDLKGLSPAQLNWKADSTRWSIAQCTEHIALSESYILGWLQLTLKQPANPEKKADVKMTTDQLIAALIDRSHKAQAPEPLKPSGRFANFQETLQAYTSRRDSTIDYLQTTHDDLMDHYMMHPVFGEMNCYDGYVFLAGHSVRHTEQIEEVMATPGFPKN